MRMFRTQFDRVRTRSESGKRYKVNYSPMFSETGSLELKEDGVTDIYAIIQSHRDSADINNIIARFTRGDVSALSARQGSFGDFTQFPKTYAEAQQKMIDATNLFMSLPVEERAQYNHNPAEFIADIGSEKWMKVLGIEMLKSEPDVVPDVVEKEGVVVE